MDMRFSPTKDLNPAALLRLPQVLALVPVCASTWWAGIKSGRFPRPVKLGPHTTCWRLSDILALIESMSDVAPRGAEAEKNDR
jgi:prophage regulatory protein